MSNSKAPHVVWHVKKCIYGDERKMAVAWCKFRNRCITDTDNVFKLYSVLHHAPKEITETLDSYLYFERSE